MNITIYLTACVFLGLFNLLLGTTFALFLGDYTQGTFHLLLGWIIFPYKKLVDRSWPER